MAETVARFRFQEHALGRPYHAARVTIRGTSEPHLHVDYYEVMVVIAGSGVHRLRSGRQPLLPGHVVLVRPRDQHAIIGDPATGVEFFNVAFSPAAWRSFVDVADLRGPAAWDAAPAPPLLRPGEPGHARLLRACEAVLHRFPADAAMLDLVRFWTEVCAVLCPPDAARPADPGRATPEWLSAACAAMRHEANLRDGVLRLLELTHVSPSHLSRSMRRHYGTTPTAYVTDLRLQHATALLATTTEPVTGIALRCGFASQSYFSRCFTQAYGVSPRRFRHDLQRKYVP
ncbi:AraC family transcriptional regulator [Dactylosporangium sp. NPDC005572]|uniref:helix-turn-helix transcriptional regulator n=1 Tax=Dactylosporangium sp. NPDC005572 TaxID=3156889 RepID=UPI0033A6EE72